MHALRLNGPFAFSHHNDLAVPTPGNGQLTVRLSAAALCGSDLPKVRSTADPRSGTPGFPVHECVGEIVDPGDHHDLRPGTRVLAMPVQECGLAEVYLADHATTHPITTAELGDAEATLIQPLATVLYATGKLAPDLTGTLVAVLGLGPIGLLCAHVLSTRGAHVTGIDPEHRDPRLLAALGVHHHVRDTSDAHAAAHPAVYEVCVEAVGHQQRTLRDAIALASHGGTVLAMGVPDEPDYVIPFETLLRANLTLIGSITPPWQRWLPAAEHHLAENLDPLRRLITHQVPVTDAEHAYRLYDRPAADRLKVVLTTEPWKRDRR
ncbi:MULTISPECIES: zinc-binding dehydrogenase [Actinosynnema]|uniref:zinc-dependent alcohol dehydrogenase n=1 Tax=Actinosynnema TaxID=40566 RepID=UPI0020A4ECED|nr:zinc-binding dehydrogenase [Actinosynnema pretiosum]MCP2098087.1 Threonine dehydrogenase [Actinosynnema pretiosum]